MEHRQLGRTGVSVSKFCLGAMMFGAWGNPDHDESIRIIHAALDAGINFIDSALEARLSGAAGRRRSRREASARRACAEPHGRPQVRSYPGDQMTMNSDRTQAYGRVVKTLDELGPAKLLDSEQERIREAADTLIFASSVEEAGAVVADVDALAEHLASSGRWSEERAQELVRDVLACGPMAPVV